VLRLAVERFADERAMVPTGRKFLVAVRDFACADEVFREIRGPASAVAPVSSRIAALHPIV
jgi:hypothetical protein